jgi:hypothetical protein
MTIVQLVRASRYFIVTASVLLSCAVCGHAQEKKPAQEPATEKTTVAKDADDKEDVRVEVKVVDRTTDKALENAKISFFLQCDCKKECPGKPCSECCPSERQMFESVTDAAGVITFKGRPGTYRIETAYRAYSKDSLLKVDAGDTEKLKVSLKVNEIIAPSASRP